jgi:hypothetical protein
MQINFRFASKFVHSRSPGSSEMQINVVTVTTVTTVTTIGHKAHSMPQIDSAQRRRDKSFTVIENETYTY